MSYLRSSFTSVTSRPWWSNGPWMSTGSIFARRSTGSNRSLRKYHDITMPEYLSEVQTCETGIFLCYLLWGLQGLDYQLHPADQQGPGRKEVCIWVKALKSTGKLYIQDQIKKYGDYDEIFFSFFNLPIVSCWLLFQISLKSISHLF